MPDVIAVVCSDIHLSHLPPKFRRAEPNWYAAMLRPLEQVRALVEEFSAPLVCAGDIFDDGWRTHKCPPELLNFAIKYLPSMYAIPGQHDLPHHRYEDIARSGYWTLVESKVVKDIHPTHPVDVESLRLYGFPWGAKLRPRVETGELAAHVAVVHHYVWFHDDDAYHGASVEDHSSKLGASLAGYDVAVFGDNHKAFTHGKVFNCGGLMIRKADEVAYNPSVGLLMRDGTVERRYLDTSMDRYAHEDEKAGMSTGGDLSGVHAFIGELDRLASKPMFDLKEAFEMHYRHNKVSDKAKELITKGMARK